MSTIIAHPTYPLQHEQRAEIIAAGTHDPAEVAAIAARYATRRNREFPDWRQTYEREVRAWLKAQAYRYPRS